MELSSAISAASFGQRADSLLFTRAVLELASSSRETCFLVGNEVASLEEDAPFIGMDPDKRQRSLGMVDVVVDGASVYPEIQAGFLDGVVPVRSYRYPCVLQVGHRHKRLMQ